MREAESTVNAAFTHECDVSADAHQIEDALQPANYAEHDADAEENFDKLAGEFFVLKEVFVKPVKGVDGKINCPDYTGGKKAVNLTR